MEESQRDPDRSQQGPEGVHRRYYKRGDGKVTEFEKRVADYFEGSSYGHLAEYLGITVEDIIEAFPEKIDEAEDDLLELLGLKDE